MPAHSGQAGRILIEAAYAAGKMLDCSGWNGLLRSNITPSDVDLCFDNNGAVLFADFSIACDSWTQIKSTLRGQRWLYESLIKSGPHCAVICKHSVQAERLIDTLKDVERFQVMVWDFEPVLSPVYSGRVWQSFVCQWVNSPHGPLQLRRRVLGASAGLVKSAAAVVIPKDDEWF